MKWATLKPGDTIGIFSPSRGITGEAPEATERAVNFLRARGYRVKLGSLTGKQDHYRSGTIAERAAEFNELLHDDSVRCMMAAIGGYVSNSILPYIDYSYFAAHPKLLVGSSDVTSLLLGIYAKTGVPTFYGPNLVTQLALPAPYPQITMDCLEQVSHGTMQTYETPAQYTDTTVAWDDPEVHVVSKPNRLRTIVPGKAVGRLIGGNLNTFTAIMGSPYMPEIKKGDILFFENVGETADACERLCSMLKLCGIFDQIAGLLIGKHKNYDDLGTGRLETDILQEVIGVPRFPILADFDCGHTAPILTLPIGGVVGLDATEKKISLRY